MTQSQNALLRDQIVGSCRLIMRHAEGLVLDVQAISELPDYKTEAENMINKADRVLIAALQAISAVKVEMGKKQLETI